MKHRELYEAWIAAERAESTRCIRAPWDILPTLARYIDRPQEHFIAVTLNGAHEVTGHKVVTVGLVNRTVVHPREIFRYAIYKNAAAVILAHNHPSGAVDPSSEDDDVTRRMVAAGQTVGIPILDHIILGTRGYYSYLDHDKL